MHLVQGEGLGQIVIHPRGQAFLPVAHERVGGQGDDAGPLAPGVSGQRGPFPLPERPGRLVPVHVRHLAVHQDQVEAFPGQPIPGP